MGNSCTVPTYGEKLKNWCRKRCCCCSFCHCDWCEEPKIRRNQDSNVVTSSPMSSGLVVAPIDENDCKCLFWNSMSCKYSHWNIKIIFDLKYIAFFSMINGELLFSFEIFI